MMHGGPLIRPNRRPTPPGRILAKHFLEPNGISITALAEATNLSRKHLSAIIHEKASLTADTAVRLGAVLGTGGAVWLKLQSKLDLWQSEQALASGTGKPVQAGRFAPEPSELADADE